MLSKRAKRKKKKRVGYSKFTCYNSYLHDYLLNSGFNPVSIGIDIANQQPFSVFLLTKEFKEALLEYRRRIF